MADLGEAPLYLADMVEAPPYPTEEINAPPFEARLSIKAIVASIRYDQFGSLDTFVHKQVNWIRLLSVFRSKKRFHMRTDFHAFELEARSSNRLGFYTDSEGVVWVRAMPR